MSRIITRNLRIGNLINFNGRPFRVNEINENAVFGVNIFQNDDVGTILEEDIKGIQFTEQLLNRLGWYKEEGGMFKLKKEKAPQSYIEGHLDIEYPYETDGIRVWMVLKDGFGTAVYLKYVHELQNLFQALHFKEL